jgi:Uma2 family endonuclease
MATAPTYPLVPVDEYLSTAYHPDMEFVDGVLVERSMPTMFHAVLQGVLFLYFHALEKQYRFKALLELRTKIVERARYRIPDLLLAATPMPKSRIMEATPLVVIEILSPDDTMSDTLQRYRDYSAIGVTSIVQMDPERYVAHRFDAGSLIETKFTGLYLPHTGETVPFDSEALFEQLRRELDEATSDIDGNPRSG